MELKRWQSLMQAFGFAANEASYEKLVSAYSEKHRHYHSTEHIVACLRHFDHCKQQANHSNEIELALWFHDAIYKPFRSDNELASANWATDFLEQNQAPEALTRRIHRLIMATEHNAPTETDDESLLVDIDLSVLGAEPAVYKQFEINVRKEYRRIPMFIYRKKRAAVLAGFLARPNIYNNEPFRAEREQQAQHNLSNVIKQLQAGM